MRALSIALVIFCHGAKTAGSPVPSAVRAWAYYGGLGVDIFFVISGFLITHLLLREDNRNAGLSLRAFYARRAFRILPAYFGYLLFVFLMTTVGAAKLELSDWVAAFTLTTDFLPNLTSRWVVGHTWSLAVEEHFYMVWPAMLVLLGTRRARLLLVLIVCVTPALRFAIWTSLSHRISVSFCTPARMDTIAAGCLLAYLVADPRGQVWMERFRDQATFLFLVAGVGVAESAAVSSLSTVYSVTLARTVEAASITFGILAVISGPHTAVGRLLESMPMATVGQFSYSLYLWQQPFLNPYSDLWQSRWPQNIVLSVVAAVVSYVLIERPFLRLKMRLSLCVAGPKFVREP